LSGHALSMAAGIATLDALDDDAYDRLEATGARLADGLTAAALEAGKTVAIARVGSLLTVFFAEAAPRDAASALDGDREAFGRFFRAMLERGVLLPPSPFEAWFISLAHDGSVIDETLDAARSAFVT
jgi:glutamate-1-semialdehyde 2,1-aminomutase